MFRVSELTACTIFLCEVTAFHYITIFIKRKMLKLLLLKPSSCIKLENMGKL